MTTLLEKARKTIKEFNLIQKNDIVIVGVSGGPDSVALLYILKSLEKELKFSLCVAHLDHMLRRDTHKDKEYVENLCNRLRVPVNFARIDVKKATGKGSLEERARNVRLEFLFKVAKEAKTRKIALGHNLDDQAETVLMRILRGTGLYGLRGILPNREIAGFKIIRPLIKVKRKDIEAFLRRKNIHSLVDASNLEDIYFRNRIRNRLLPFLEHEFNRNIKDILSYMAGTCGSDYDYLMNVAQRSLKAVRKSRRRIDLKRFLRLHPSLQRLVLRLMILEIKGDWRRLSLKHIQEIEDLILKRPPQAIVDLPKEISVRKDKATLQFYKR